MIYCVNPSDPIKWEDNEVCIVLETGTEIIIGYGDGKQEKLPAGNWQD